VQWLHEASPEKLATWDAFFKIEPWGCDWERTAVVAQTVSNTVAACHGVKYKSLYKLSDFMPTSWFGRRKSKQTNVQSIQDFFAFASRYQKK